MRLFVQIRNSIQIREIFSTFSTVKVETAKAKNIEFIYFAGELDILRSLYHHQDQDEGQTYSRLPPRKEFDIVAEDAEAPLGQGDYVGLRTIGIGTTINTGAFPPLDLFEEPLCHEKIEYIYPKTALTKNKQWR